VALVGDDVAEPRHVAALEILAQLGDRHLPGPVVAVPRGGEVLDAVVLGNVQRVAIRSPVALRIADALITGVRQTLQVRLPADSGVVELTDQARRVDLVLPVRIVAGHVEDVPAEDAHVVGLAAVREGAEVVGLQTECLRQVVQVRRRLVADHVLEAVVLFHDEENVVQAWRRRGVRGRAGGRRERGARDQRDGRGEHGQSVSSQESHISS
jgi:hypothetical protein